MKKSYVVIEHPHDGAVLGKVFYDWGGAASGAGSVKHAREDALEAGKNLARAGCYAVVLEVEREWEFGP